MSGNGWTIYIRDERLRRVGVVDDYAKLDIIAKFNDVGTFILVIDRDSPHAATLTTPGYGIQVVHEDTGYVVTSGPITGPKHTHDDNLDKIELAGKDDNYYIATRVSHPSPTESLPPYSVTSHHEVSGTASTVLREYVDKNLGPGAISERRNPHVTIGPDPVVGKTISGKLRWGKLLEDLQALATSGGDIGFRLVDVGGALQFQVYEPVDRTGTVRFSEEFGNLAAFTYQVDAPTGTYVYVGGQGELTARTIKEGSDPTAISTWGRVEVFEDRRDTDDDAELQQKIDESLIEHGATTDLSATPIDTESVKFGRDYTLGDRVMVLIEGAPSVPGTGLEGGQITEIVREVALNLRPEETDVQPKIATPNRVDVLRLFREFRRLSRRVSNLENR
ncbi:siphovirus ReqiPepy6 Gp37-like family protein [Actinopolyspora halophila]|uniref:siphovirus ReqiPepy6 Gp37-like family protein n=1 Tax=Actinopolyspora halophila TaxID=1850 RepID=UPI00036FC791|nr:siphovirus ReqiPepy6 Gp37-like family protein [Actinopolyspora halophila]